MPTIAPARATWRASPYVAAEPPLLTNPPAVTLQKPPPVGCAAKPANAVDAVAPAGGMDTGNRNANAQVAMKAVRDRRIRTPRRRSARRDVPQTPAYPDKSSAVAKHGARSRHLAIEWSFAAVTVSTTVLRSVDRSVRSDQCHQVGNEERIVLGEHAGCLFHLEWRQSPVHR